MDLKISPPYQTRSVYPWALMFAISTFLLPGSVAADVLFSDDFSNSTQVDNRWSCVDGRGQIQAIRGTQLAVDDSGNINNASFAPSVAVGDLNGDGLPDLVVADSFGFFWYFQNHGTKDEPTFTTSEIMSTYFAVFLTPFASDFRDAVMQYLTPIVSGFLALR